MHLIVEHWDIIAMIVIPIAIDILNAATKHWSAWPKLMRWIGFTVEALNVIRIRLRKPKLRKIPPHIMMRREGD